jgi:hypothetical protein
VWDQAVCVCVCVCITHHLCPPLLAQQRIISMAAACIAVRLQGLANALALDVALAGGIEDQVGRDYQTQQLLDLWKSYV